MNPKENIFENIVINAPPPYLNSSLHIGHLYSFSTLVPFYNLVDTISRDTIFKRSKKYMDLLDLPKINLTLSLGVDINGLPLTRSAKEKSKINGTSFKTECASIIKENSAKINKIYEDLGLFNLRDVKNYTTADDTYKHLSDFFLSKLIERNLISEKKMPLKYCKNCNTFLSNSEIELVTEPGKRYYFTVHEKENPHKNYSIMTTRPEFLLNCCAFVANPNDSRYIHLKNSRIGFIYEGISYYFPVYYSKYIHKNVGSGLVFLAKWGSTLDLELARDLKLEGSSSIYDDKGDLKAQICKNHKVNSLEEVKKKLLASNMLTEGEYTQVKYLKHTERGDCKKEILILESSQVVITPTEEILSEFIDYINTIEIPIDSYKNQLIENIKSLKEWCISRGPQYYSFSYDFKGKNIVLDTWVISSLSHLVHVTPECKIWRIQGNDIIRTWLLYSLFTNFIIGAKYDISKCFIHKMVVDENNQKISKSKNNGPDANQLLKTVDIHALRFYFCQKPFSNDFSFKYKELNDTVKFFLKFKNLKIKIEPIVSGVKEDPIKEKLWMDMVLSAELNTNSKINLLLKEFKQFFYKDMLKYNFTRILNVIKTFVYYLSSNIHKLEYVFGSQHKPENYEYFLLKIWSLIEEFIACF